jgi:aspartyl-tRNA(Asn)/glutamyl-tRNA(Gln) amidotransferase subunit C
MTEAELVELSSQFGMILDAVARVQEVNLEGVKATSHPQPIENITRPDVVLPSLSPADALSGAPAQEEQRFRVPQILGEE